MLAHLGRERVEPGVARRGLEAGEDAFVLREQVGDLQPDLFTKLCDGQESGAWVAPLGGAKPRLCGHVCLRWPGIALAAGQPWQQAYCSLGSHSQPGCGAVRKASLRRRRAHPRKQHRPQVLHRTVRREMQPHPARGLFHPHAELEQMTLQSADLRLLKPRAAKLLAHVAEQNERRCVQDQAELIRDEPMATSAVEVLSRWREVRPRCKHDHVFTTQWGARLGRRGVRSALQRALQAAGIDKPGAIPIT